MPSMMTSGSSSTTAAAVAFVSLLGRHHRHHHHRQNYNFKNDDDDDPCSLLRNIRGAPPALYTTPPPIWDHSPLSPSHNYLHNIYSHQKNDDDIIDFFDSRESMSMASRSSSSSDLDDDSPLPLSTTNTTHYYDAVPGFSRQQRLTRKTKWRFIWGCVGLSITFGASLLAYSCFI